MSNSIYPPKPRFALAIGVIGHRPDRLPDPSSYAGRKIVTDVGRVLDEVAREAVSAHGKHKALFASDPSLLSLVSTLAEGTDHIVAEAAEHGDRCAEELPGRRRSYAKYSRQILRSCHW